MFPFKTDRGVQAFPLMLKLRKRNRELTGKSSGAQGGSAHGPVRRPRPVSAGAPLPVAAGSAARAPGSAAQGPSPTLGATSAAAATAGGTTGRAESPTPSTATRPAPHGERTGTASPTGSPRAAHLLRSAAGRAQFSPAGSSRGQAPRAGWRGSIRLRQCLRGAAGPSFAAPAL